MIFIMDLRRAKISNIFLAYYFDCRINFFFFIEGLHREGINRPSAPAGSGAGAAPWLSCCCCSRAGRGSEAAFGPPPAP